MNRERVFNWMMKVRLLAVIKVYYSIGISCKRLPAKRILFLKAIIDKIKELFVHRSSGHVGLFPLLPHRAKPSQIPSIVESPLSPKLGEEVISIKLPPIHPPLQSALRTGPGTDFSTDLSQILIYKKDYLTRCMHG
jgi:hypothetical protein